MLCMDEPIAIAMDLRTSGRALIVLWALKFIDIPSISMAGCKQQNTRWFQLQLLRQRFSFVSRNDLLLHVCFY